MVEQNSFSDYNSASDDTSQTLIDAMINGEELAWKKIATVWGRALLQHFYRKGLQTSDAEEITQNVLVKMYSAISKGKFTRDGKGKKLKYWVYRIAENEVHNFRDRFLNKPNSPGGSTHQEILANVGSEEDSVAFEAVLVSQLLDVIKDDFEASTWQVFQLHHFEHVPTNEIAAQLGIKAGTVRQKLFRVKQRLKEELELAMISEGN